ncbi:hypothetical protein AVEN_19548-1 [Araneus ventricosus]|uniref:Uncharacterized protein n=1 Tax=Araneus ventricosus TaxID=182803 RepID=A0A4Y2X2L8_ARAVE|nr:hypothetical protein AVEN_19548-1 [Araneus ventricosus]
MSPLHRWKISNSNPLFRPPSLLYESRKISVQILEKLFQSDLRFKITGLFWYPRLGWETSLFPHVNNGKTDDSQPNRGYQNRPLISPKNVVLMLRSRFREGRAPGSKTDSTEDESKKSASSTNVEGRTSSRWSAGKVSVSERKSSRFENRFHRR